MPEMCPLPCFKGRANHHVAGLCVNKLAGSLDFHCLSTGFQGGDLLLVLVIMQGVYCIFNLLFFPPFLLNIVFRVKLSEIREKMSKHELMFIQFDSN